jgi:hypothetical protein
LLVSGHYRLDVSLFEKIQDYEEKTLSSSKWEARQVILDYIDPMYSLSFSSIHIGLHYLILYLSLILRIWVHTWLVMFSHAVMSVVQIFPSSVILSLACVFVRDGLPSVEMWGDRCEDRCCGLSKVGMVEIAGFCQVMWLHPLWCWVWLVSLREMVSHLLRCEVTIVRIDAVVWARLEW